MLVSERVAETGPDGLDIEVAETVLGAAGGSSEASERGPRSHRRTKPIRSVIG